MTDTDYNRIMSEVQQAYRIVAAYQQRMLYIMQTFRSYFPELVNFEWMPANTARPPQGATFPWDDHRWGWDGLPYYNLQCSFVPEGVLQRKEPQPWRMSAGEYCIFARLITNSDFHPNGKAEPDPASLTDGQSQLVLWLYQLSADASGYFHPNDLFKRDREKFRDLADQWKVMVDPEVRRLKVAYAIADLLPENAAKQAFEALHRRLAADGIIPASDVAAE